MPETIRTSCTWDNTTSSDIKFPREMCFGVGFALATGTNPTAPAMTEAGRERAALEPQRVVGPLRRC